MIITYPYLEDKEFLRLFDEEPRKEQFIRIYVLDFQYEEIIASIEGKSTSGNVNLSGTSNMRRTASCSLVVDPDGIYCQGYDEVRDYYNITEVENLISLNKKVKIETGFRNTLAKAGYYTEYDIIWFPCGTYVIKGASVSENNSGINISLTLNDKCALLNGDMGGIIPAGTIFSENELYNLTNTSSTKEKLLLKDIIKYIVVDFGGERPENVVITDIDDTIVKVMKWSGKSSAVYLVTANGKKRLTTIEPSEEHIRYSYGQNIGYMNEPFVYPGTLECNAGESAASVLDKIKNTLGNFEWFYDIHGVFHFQKTKNYLNESITINDIKDLNENNLLSFMNDSKSVYNFNDKKLITAMSSNPQYQNIKNDFIIWGTMKTAAGAQKPIRYHLAFDNKPRVDTTKVRPALVWKDFRGIKQVVMLNENTYKLITTDDPTKVKGYYNIEIDTTTTKGYKIWYWDEEYKNFRTYSEIDIVGLRTDDWRTELYYQGLEADNKTFSKNYYAAELNAEWPKIYDVTKTKDEEKTDTFKDITIPVYDGGYKDQNLTAYEYWLDFLEGDSGNSQSISQFNVSKIGRRTKVVTDNNSNCIFPVEIPNYIYVNADGSTKEDLKLAADKGQEVIQVSPEMFRQLTLGGAQNSAYDKMKELLFTHTQYNESLSLTAFPIYYLEPNTRITIENPKLGIYGDYMIKTISLPLTTNGTSSISCTRALEKSY